MNTGPMDDIEKLGLSLLIKGICQTLGHQHLAILQNQMLLQNANQTIQKLQTPQTEAKVPQE